MVLCTDCQEYVCSFSSSLKKIMKNRLPIRKNMEAVYDGVVELFSTDQRQPWR